jgi:GTP:adenosylcobinamide-phosphate guanylyltransferase
MVLRVLDALREAEEVNRVVLCGPHPSVMKDEPELGKRIASGAVKWVENRATPSSSAYHVLQRLPRGVPVLVTTADHALLNGQTVDFFCSQARLTGCDVAAGVASYERVAAAWPETRRTVIKLKDGGYCGCNLFAFLTPRAMIAADHWRRVEKQRKKTLRVIGTLGWVAVLRYLLGQLTLSEGLERISRRMKLRAGAVIIPFPEAAVDVDSVDDWRLAESIVASRAP